MSRVTGLMRELALHGRVEVKVGLTREQESLVRDELVVQRVYQDLPVDVAYPFRPKRYYLVATSRLRTIVEAADG